MSVDLKVPDYEATWFLRRPVFWTHALALVTYPYRLTVYWIKTRRLMRIFDRQRSLAIAPPVVPSAQNVLIIRDVERETRIDKGPLR